MVLRTSLRDELIQASNGPVDEDSKSNPLEAADYDPFDDVMALFNSPGDLADLDSLMAYTNTYKLEMQKELKHRRKKEIETMKGDSNPIKQLEQLQIDLTHFIGNFNSAKQLAQNTGGEINKMTAGIKKLDNCKRNLTLSMTIVKRLEMLVTAYESLQKLIEESKGKPKNYQQVKQLLEAVLELMNHFQNYKSIDEINTLDKKISSLRNEIIDGIFKDYKLEQQNKLKNNTLPSACEVLTLFGESYKNKLCDTYISGLLKELRTIFKSTEEAGSLDNLGRRYIFFERILNNFEIHHSKMFPKDWKMSIRISKEFCKITKEDLKLVTEKETRLQEKQVDARLLLNSLSETLKFESFLNDKFKLYGEMDDHTTYKFDKSISDVFEPYLNVWIDYQSSTIDKKFLDYLNPTTMYQKSGIAATSDDNSQETDSKNLIIDSETINVLESAADLFRTYRQMLTQLSNLTRGQPLVRLSTVFAKYLMEYSRRILSVMIPTDKDISSANTDEQDKIIDILCLVLNTADYCFVTSSQLESKMKSLVEINDLKDQIDFTPVRERYLQMETGCVKMILSKIGVDLQYSWREMLNNNWKLLKDVTSESRYVTSLRSVITDDCKRIFPQLSKASFVRNFIDNLIDLVINTFTYNFVKLRPITEVMAEQFTLDLQTLKEFFLQLPLRAPNGAKIEASRSFNKSVNNKIGSLVSIMKVLMTSHKPMGSYIMNYFCNIKDSNFDNFIKTLQLKGYLTNNVEKDKYKYVDSFKEQLRAYQNTSSDPLIDSNKLLESLELNDSKSSQGSKSPAANISNFFTSIGPNRKSRDSLEKNIVKTLSDNKINENIWKLFKKGNNNSNSN